MAASWQAAATVVESRQYHCDRCKKGFVGCDGCSDPVRGGDMVWCSKSPSGSRHYCKLCTEKLG
jgi:hypothetical protein